MNRIVVTAIVALFCAACGGSSPATSEAPGATGGEAAAPAPPPAPVVREVTIPDGTALRLDLTTPLASDSSKVEDVVRATLREAVKVGDETVLPVGTELTGTVTGAEGSGRVKGRARLSFRFDALRTANERHAIQSAPIALEAEATKGEDAKKIGIGAGIGAAVGAIVGGGDGAAKGAAIGGAGGTGVVLATKGKEVRLGSGANVSTRLTAPLTVEVQ
jgi:hypothetical protein